MEFLNGLDNFVATAPWGWIIGLSSLWVILGALSLRWTVMGLIGYHNNPKGNWMLLAFIILWPIPFGYVWGSYLLASLGDLLERKPSGNFYTCKGKGGRYEIIGVGIQIGNIKPVHLDAHYYGLSIGAGTSREEKLTIYIEIEGHCLYYTGFTPDDSPRMFYRDTGSGKIYHRNKADFAERMMLIK